ncbi:BCCT family transporter [Salinisphaera sp. W335]|uniref:BCCT family transporter n=2 Tax=Spectribacter hydrogenoxidans TaxID=3075608 RepID=A0ABU3C2I2_9GAMM|nr:BCCT family transporter [Salinisphaera sp. W335]MDT0635773.1 BCCT family transporter [Salinisphaera sp. W335]
MSQDAEVAELQERYDTEYEVGEDNIHPFGLDLHNPVFLWSAILIVIFVAGSMLFPDISKTALTGARDWVINTFDWLFLSAGNFFVLFCLALIVLPFGRIRLGGQDAEPAFSRMSWFAMLFAAGMGIGLMFWSVAEPVGYFTEWAGSPLNVAGGTDAARTAAMGAVMYHWALHPWAIYGVVALSLAFFAYNKGLPLAIRSVFYPLFGDRVWGPLGNVIDTLAVVATIFGLATSLGFGAQQAAGGMQFLFGIADSLMVEILIIAGVTAVALVSVVRGIDGGVKLLSNINIMLAGLLLLFVIITGSVMGFFASLGTTVAGYAEYLLPLSNPVGREDETFYHSWTIFYWAWWISWSPFVGMFIARVSRGRTVREFLTAVLIVPMVVTAIWMSAFGGSGLDQAVNGVGSLANGISDSSLSLFHMLENLPLAGVTSFLAITLVLVFFITSSDSGSLVIDTITAGGKTEAPVAQRVFWCVAEGLIAAALLVVGGAEALSALQAAAVTTGLPFTLVLLLMCVALLKGLNHELQLLRAEEKSAGVTARQGA